MLAYLLSPRYCVLWTTAIYWLSASFQVSALAHSSNVFGERQSSGGISWFTCPDGENMQCAFFSVPRDYTNPTDNDTVSIFMRKLPATVPAEDRLGTILTNPGGPGGSGTAWLAQRGESNSAITEGRYDIIGFDPRGINMTTPQTGCFDTEGKGLQLQYQQTLLGTPFDARGSLKLPNSSRAASERIFVNKLSASEANVGLACKTRGNEAMLQSVGTVLVVKDMVRIMEALGDTSINYWGYSYGTVLGATFAAMYPELVNRMVLDGVSNAESYFNDIFQWGRDGMTDTHKTLTGFLSSCVDAGPDRCAFAAAPNGTVTTTTAGLRKRLNALYARLRDGPMSVPDSSAGPGILTASDLKSVVFFGLYSPVVWPGIAQDLAEVERGNAANVYAYVHMLYGTIEPGNFTDNVYGRYKEKYGLPSTTPSIMCSDSPQANVTLDQYIAYFHELSELSPTGEQWALYFGKCRGWPFRAIERYTGPWTVADGLKKTKFPILFMSLDADPVTPLRSAVKMSEGFGSESAVLLVQQGFGHCTDAHPSLCTMKNVRDYFIEGKVPANGTHCTPEPGFIFPSNTTGAVRRSTKVLEKRDALLLDALDKLRGKPKWSFHPH
ncbi:alpha/beta-hydrolase [Ceratobasidium sp. AG-I]|nr:alpha/beta-hydrolase [Ceratobasidium sp. AG-I]